MGLCPGILRMGDRWLAKLQVRDRDEVRRIGVLSEDMGGCDRRNRGQQLPLLQPLEFPANLRLRRARAPRREDCERSSNSGICKRNIEVFLGSNTRNQADLPCHDYLPDRV